MSWVCGICSTSNIDSDTCCVVCGVERPAIVEHDESKSEELKIVFSDFEAFKESVKSLFTKTSSVKREKKPRTKKKGLKKSESVASESVSVAEPVEEKKPKRDRGSLLRSAFAKPWPEHEIKFDTSVIEDKGYVKSERETLNGVNGYRFYKADDTSQFIRVEMAIIQKMANKE